MSSRLDAGRLLCVGLSGPRLTAMERRLIRRLRPGGIILFGDNYESLEQLKELCAAIRKACDPAPLISVDQEGGRVVRFGEPFTHLPPARQLAREHSPRKLTAIAEEAGRELHDAGIDIDFVPVLDVLTNRASQVIGDRASGSDAATVRRF